MTDPLHPSPPAPAQDPPVTLLVKYLRGRPRDALTGNPSKTFHALSAETARLDLYAQVDDPIQINPQRGRAVRTGVALLSPPGYEGQVTLCPALTKLGVVLANAPAMVRDDCRGEVTLFMTNLQSEVVTIQPGDLVGQVVVAPVARPRDAQAVLARPPGLLRWEPSSRAPADVDAVVTDVLARLAADPKPAPHLAPETRVAAQLLIGGLVTPEGQLPDTVVVRLLAAPCLAKLVHATAYVPALDAPTFALICEHALASPDLDTRRGAVLAADLRDVAGALPTLLRGFAAIEPDAALADYARSLAQRLDEQATGDTEAFTLRARVAVMGAPAQEAP